LLLQYGDIIRKKNRNNVKLLDLTTIEKNDLLTVPWNDNFEVINHEVNKIIRGKKEVVFDNSRGEIRDTLPLMINPENMFPSKQPRYNIYRNLKPDEKGKKIVSGFPLNDSRHQTIKAPHGFTDGTYIGFMSDLTPVRLKQDTFMRMSNKPDRIWFYLDNRIQQINLQQIFSGPTDHYSCCAYDLESSKITLAWFAISKAINGIYPIWANMFNIWSPKIKKQFEKEWNSLCFAFALAENRCIVTKFEKDNPVESAPEIFIENPLCPNNPDSFWTTTLDSQVNNTLAKKLVDSIKSFYDYWNIKYCKGQTLENVGLHDESYFKYFSYPDFITPHSGIIQIKKFAENTAKNDILERHDLIKSLTKQVREKIYSLLVEEFKYFD